MKKTALTLLLLLSACKGANNTHTSTDTGIVIDKQIYHIDTFVDEDVNGYNHTVYRDEYLISLQSKTGKENYSTDSLTYSKITYGKAISYYTNENELFLLHQLK